MAVNDFPTHCPICNKRLDRPNDRALGICSALLCRGPFLRKKGIEEEARRKANRASVAHDTLSALRVRPDTSQEMDFQWPLDAQVVVVPCLDKVVTELPKSRRKLFVEHLITRWSKRRSYPRRGESMKVCKSSLPIVGEVRRVNLQQSSKTAARRAVATVVSKGVLQRF